MNTCSRFMDKQIMDLSSSSPPSTDFIDLMNNSSDSQEGDHQKHRIGDNGLESKKEEIVPSYDFQPIRPYTAGGLSHSALDLAGSTTSTSARVWSPSDFKPISTSSNRGFGSFDDSIEPAKLVSEKGQNVSSTAIISEIDKTMKKHVDTLLHVMEGVSARVTQLETRSHNLEYLVDDLKASVENSHGRTDGKMRQLENILVEVQSGVQLLKDKQEIIEAELRVSKLQVSEVDHHPKTHSVHVDATSQSPAPVPTQQMPQFPHTSFPQPPSSAAAPSQQIHQQPSSHQSLQQPSSPLLAQLPSQFSPQQEPYSPPPSHSQPPPPNQPPYQAPPQTQPPHQPPYQPPPSHSQPPPPNQSPYQVPLTQPPHQPPYQPPPQQPQYPQQPPLSSGYNTQEQQPYPVQSYSPNPPRQQQPAGSPPSQQFYNAPHPQPSMYDGAGGRSNPSVPPGYSSEPYPYTGSPSSVKQPLMSNSGTGYPQLSTAHPLPHALPMASAVSGGSSSPRSESRAPIDDVIDRVTTMGFPRDQVRATVRKLTENGQAVDLNVVLDKLMNDGGAPPGGWLGSR